MRFIDEVEIEVQAGKGGAGCIAFRREKYRPLGGPAGGDGGRGGSVVFVADTRLSTLLDLRYRRILKAGDGEPGRGKDQHGRGAADLEWRVPVGTQVFDADGDLLLHDLDRPGMRVTIAQGGRGGRGNLRFATPWDRAPRRADPGEAGEQRRLRLELKLLADVGLVGFPNVGKSTLIARVSRARPKIADYPFTTLVPNLGVVSLGMERSFVLADIPGIIAGAATGAGLGLRFLRHIERTRVLVHLLSLDAAPEREPLSDLDALLHELTTFAPALASRPSVVALNKCDLPEVQATVPALRTALAARGLTLYPISAHTGDGVQALLVAIEALLLQHESELAVASAGVP